MNNKLKNKELIEDLESKISVLKEIQKKEGDIKKFMEEKGMIEAFEYSLDNIKRLPIWIPNFEKFIHIMIGFIIGFLIGLIINIA